MNLRILEAQWAPFVESLCLSTELETAGIILAERMSGGHGLIARHLIVVPEEAYLIRRGDQIRLDPVALNRLIRPAREGDLSVITVHTHPGTALPWFSVADDLGDARLMPSLFNQMPGPHGSMVIAGASGVAAGRVWPNPDIKTDLRLRIVGLALQVPAKSDPREENSAWYDRQRLALGPAGQEVLGDLHVAIVGLGGTGSVAFLQLAHLGVRRITVIDGDRIGRSNVSRILGAGVRDVGCWKVDVAARYAENLGLGTEERIPCRRVHAGTDSDPGDSGLPRCRSAKLKDTVRCDGAVRLLAGEEPLCRALPLPVGHKHLSEWLRQPHLPVLLAFSAANPDDASLAVQIGDLEFGHFRNAKSRTVHRGEHRPVLEVPGCFKQGLDLGFAENDGQLLFVPWKRNPVDVDSAAQRVLVEEPERADGLNVCAELYPFLIEQEKLV
jgi:hypothetical protein